MVTWPGSTLVNVAVDRYFTWSITNHVEDTFGRNRQIRVYSIHAGLSTIMMSMAYMVSSEIYAVSTLAF